jgi:uncharacterized protein YbjT (DUF2867 family)
MVLVVGATGLVGREICQKLTKRGEKVRALVRPTSSREKTETLRSAGCELCVGDLKDSRSISDACCGVSAVISTASSTLSWQPGDSIESVDAVGQLQLVDAAKSANIDRFILVSFRRPTGISFPLADAKRRVEESISALNFTIVQASWFMEVWLNPALGFDYANATARIYGPGTRTVSWVSFRDVAEMCVLALENPAAYRRTIAFGGPEALTPLDVVSRFERIAGRPFRLEHVSEEALRQNFEEAKDSLQKSFAGLMLGYLSGDAMDMAGVADEFRIRLTSVDGYAHQVLANTAN